VSCAKKRRIKLSRIKDVKFKIEAYPKSKFNNLMKTMFTIEVCPCGLEIIMPNIPNSSMNSSAPQT